MAWYISGTVTLGIWARKAGAWQRVTTRQVGISQTYADGGQKTYSWDASFDVDLGPGVQDFGVTIESFSGGISAALIDFVSAAWNAVSSSGERSATPSGQQSIVTVRPQ